MRLNVPPQTNWLDEFTLDAGNEGQEMKLVGQMSSQGGLMKANASTSNQG